MPRTFETRDAKELIANHKSLQKTADNMKKDLDSCEKRIRQIVNQTSLTVFKDAVVREVTEGIAADVRQPVTENLIRALYLYIHKKEYGEHCFQTAQQHEKTVNRLISELSVAANSLRWMFASKDSKEKAEAAFVQLKNLYDSDYSSAVNDAKRFFDSHQDAGIEVSWQDFEDNRNAYAIAAGAAADQKKLHGSNIEIFDDLDKQWTAVEENYQRARAQIKKLEGDIKACTKKYRAAEAAKTLKDIPVDEINRESSGIRVKALKDGGYQTMADLSAASKEQIAGCYGISADTAALIKEKTESYYNRVLQTAKVRLTPDNRGKEADELVSVLYVYRMLKHNQDEIRKYYPSSKNLKNARKNITQAGGGLQWLFLSEEQKKNIRDSYLFLKEQLASKCIAAVQSWPKDRALTNLSERYLQSAWNDFEKNPIAYTNILENLLPGVFSGSDSRYGLPEDLALEIQDEALFPNGLLCQLRKYQEWGVKYALHQGDVLLGDEMGLGKTVQAIATMVSLRNTGERHFMVVCPASVIANWCREVTKHSKLTVTRVHGADRLKAFASWIRRGGVAVTTYETTGALDFDDDFMMGLIVVDEAHYIKNPDARRSQNVRRICAHAKRHLFLTGTALENKVDEMISLVDILNPSVAQSLERVSFMSTAPQFREIVAPVYYRRKREDVLTELPDLIESEEWCSLTEEEREIYEESVLAKRYPDIRRVSWNVEDIHTSSKGKRLMEIVDEAMQDERKVLVFSFFLNTIQNVNKLVGQRLSGTINGSVSPQKRQEIIDAFDKSTAGSVLTAQIQSGGTGLNIQSASVVIICEPQLKPSIENQAVSRAYRMGQARNVLVYRLLCEDTVDERIMDILAEKQAVFNAFADQSVAAEKSVEIDNKSFGEIIQEEIDRINSRKQQMS